MSVTEGKRQKSEQIDEDEIEIRLSDIIQFLKDSRWAVLRWTVVSLIIGTLYSITKPNEFTGTVRVMPELRGSAGTGGLGDLKSLAGLAGVNLDNSNASEAIRPDLYPDIIQSLPFALHLLRQPVTTTDTDSVQTLQTYLIKQANSGFLSQINQAIFGQGVDKNTVLPKRGILAMQMTSQQEGLSKQINQRVTAIIDKKSGIVIITGKMPDPIVAATVARQTLDYLTNYVTSYRTGKSRHQVQFLSQQVRVAQQRYQESEAALSSYRDRNRSLFLNTAKIEEQRLQANYLLAQTVYNDLSKQLEQARIKVQEEVPVFQVLEQAHVPLHKSEPNRTIIVISFTIFGTLLGLAAFFVRWFVQR